MIYYNIIFRMVLIIFSQYYAKQRNDIKNYKTISHRNL